VNSSGNQGAQWALPEGHELILFFLSITMMKIEEMATSQLELIATRILRDMKIIESSNEWDLPGICEHFDALSLTYDTILVELNERDQAQIWAIEQREYAKFMAFQALTESEIIATARGYI